MAKHIHTPSTVLITGASRGLGAALARALARLGWTVILDARGAEALEALRTELAPLTTVIAVPGDITDPEHRAALQAVVHAQGGLDALVNNASTLGVSPRPNLLDYPLDELTGVYQTNVVAPLALIQVLHGEFKANPRILNVTSDAGVEAYAGWGGYGSSKAALEQLSAILANERPDWRVYWVDPGDMRTQMHQEAFPGEDISDRPLPDESIPGFLTLLTGDLPSGRYQARKLNTAAEPSAPVSEMRVVVTVPDFDKARAFYEHGLGLKLIDQWVSEKSHGMLLDAGRATLEIVDAAQAAEIDAIEVGHRSAGQVRLAFGVDSVDKIAPALLEQGASAISQPVLTPWGHRNQRLRAPNGMHDAIDLTLSEGEEKIPAVVK